MGDSTLQSFHAGISTGAIQRVLPRQPARKHSRLTVAAGNEDRAIDLHSTDLLASLAECPEEAQHAARDDCDNSWTPDVMTSTWAPNWPYRIEGTMSNIVERRNSNASVLVSLIIYSASQQQCLMQSLSEWALT